MKKILIVDDQPEISRLLEIVLRSPERKLLHAESGEEGLAAAREHHPDLILLDIMMPGGMDGYGVAKILKDDPETAGAIVVAMTAKVGAADRAAALAAGADDFVSKPFDVMDVKRQVEALLG